MFVGDVEGLFEGDAGCAQHAFFKGARDERDAVGNAARRREFRQRVSGIGSPVAARLRDFDETGAQGERGMAGEIGEGEHLVAERRDEEQIDLGKDARHFVGDLAAEAIGLHEIDGGEKA